MKLPLLKRLVRDDYQDAPDFMGRLFDSLNPFIEAVYNGFNHQLTLSDNVACQIATATFDVPSNYLAPDAALACAAHVSASSSTASIPPAASTTTDFDAVDNDGSGLITTGSNWRMTVPVGGAGLWMLTAGLAFADNAAFVPGVFYALRLNVNNAFVGQFAYGDGKAAGGNTRVPTIAGTLGRYLNDGDYVQVTAFQNTAGSAALVTGSATTHFMAYRVASGPAAATNFPAVKVTKALKTAVQGVIPVLLVDKTSSAYAPIYKPVSVDWRELDDRKTVQVNHVAGVVPGHKYTLTMLVF